MRSYRWAWFVLACVTAAGLLYTLRYGYAACDTDGCVVIDRWTGGVRFEETQEAFAPDDGGAVVRDTGRSRGGAAGGRRALATYREGPSRPDRSSRAARSR
jgi:hypothetical protein